MKISRLFVIALVGFFITFSSCKKEGPTTFTLQLKAKYGTQNFELNSFNTDAAGHFLQTQNLEFYLSHINLIKSDGTLVPVKTVAIFDFSDTTNLSISVSNIEGEFTGISFACGLDSLMNDTTTPADYQAPNPLSGAYNMPWPMMKYQFEILDGLWDTQDTFLHNAFLYHIGTNSAYRTTSLNKTFTVSGNPYTLVMYLDLAQIFKNTTTNEALSIVTQSSSMSSSADDPTILPTFADNFAKSFTFQGP
jgi:hypothetical protein